MPNIFEAIRIKNVEFKNRIVMAPMVPFSLPTGKDGIMSDDVQRYYMQRTSGGMGLMISQSLSVTSEKVLDGASGVYADDHINYLKKIIDKCHNNGTKFFAQLAYPSVGYHKGDSINHLSESELEKIKFEFVRAAKICKQAGCDGIELHGAHGFFLNMMACPISNERKDEYGGDLNGRLRFVKNIMKEIKMFADDDFIISYRMGWNGDLDIDIKTAQELEHTGIELLHISSGIPVNRKMEKPIDFPFNETVYTGVQIKKQVDIPVTVVNDIKTIERGNVLLENNLCDFVAYGKPFLTDEAFLKNDVRNYNLSSNMPDKAYESLTNGTLISAQMNFLNLAQKRYSVRKFMNKEVEKEKVDLILEAGRIAPTAVNYQPQRILLFNSEDSLNNLSNCTPYLFQAPLAMLICYDNNVSWKRPFDSKDMGEVDASIVATHMMLEVANLELGSTWVGHFDAQKIRNTFKLPENIIPVILLPIGYPDKTSIPHPNHDRRLNIGKTVFYNSFSNN